MFIAITTGNWITIQSNKDGVVLPCFFARGRGHGTFKKKILELFDEGFAMAPLGKLLVNTTVEELNRRLHYSDKPANPAEKSYDAIWTPAKKAKSMKVVSTIRQKEGLLRDHSAHLKGKLGAFATLAPADAASTAQASAPIADVQHLLFPFDQFVDDTIEDQIELELPHRITRDKDFMREVFRIQVE